MKMPDEDSLSVNSLFVEPPKQHKSFSLRKRKKDQEDSLSTHSTLSSCGEGEDDGPSKRKKRLGKVASLANLFAGSPGSGASSMMHNARQAIKRSISGMLHPAIPLKETAIPVQQNNQDNSGDKSPTLSSSGSVPSSPALMRTRGSIVSLSRLSTSSSMTPYRPPAHTPTKHRVIRLWSETWGKTTALSLTNQEIKRQEAIYELWHGECDLIEDISMLQRNYHDSLVRLGLINNAEAEQIFGGIQSLLPVHIELKEELANAKGPDGSVQSVASALLKWVPKLEVYVLHCANQVRSKSVLDEKRSSDKRVEDFLTRCLESPFSRRLDIWSYLDVPRSRLVKYPLLIKQILKFTPEGHGDQLALDQVLRIMNSILERVDRSAGLGRCRHVIAQMELSEDDALMSPVLKRATSLICEGPLKTAQGIKLQCFLFDSGLILCRPSSNSGKFILYKPPIDVCKLRVTDQGTKVGRNNSFLPGSSSSSGLSTKHVFRVETGEEGGAVTLVTFNEHNKKQWMLGFHRVIEQWQAGVKLSHETTDSASVRQTVTPVRDVPKIKASFDIRGSYRRGSGKPLSVLPRGKIQVASAPQLPRGLCNNKPIRFLRSKGSVCLNQTLSPETHRICTRSCTSLMNQNKNTAAVAH